MSFPQGLATFPGVESVVSAEFVLQHGITPGICLMTITPQKTLPLNPGTLALRYAGLVLTFPNCIPDKTTFEFNQAGELWRFSLKDRRWKWAYGALNGRWNLRQPDSTEIIDKTEQLDFPTEKTVKELMEECLEAMGEGKYTIRAKLPADARPTVEWEYENPARALAALCDTYGCRVVLKLDNTVSIDATGEGADLPGGPVVSDSGGFDPPESPSSLVFVGGPTRYQVDVRLEAVGEEVDGRILPIDQLSYMPSGGWSKTQPATFDSIQDYRQRQLAFKSVFKWYRIHDEPQGADGNPLFPVGRKEPVRQRRDMLPLGQEQTVRVKDRTSGLEKRAKAIVYGVFYPGWAPRNSSTPNNYNLPAGQSVPPRKFTVTDTVTGSSIPEGGDTVYFYPFEIDQERGIVMFDRAVRKLNSSNAWDEPLLILRTGCCLRDEEDHTLLRWTRERKLGSYGTGPLVIRDDDLFLEVKPEPNSRHARNPLEPDYEPIRPESSTNEDKLKKEADALLDTATKAFQSVKARMVTYAGLVPVNPDGAIQQVSWSIGAEGAFTRASRNDELAVLSTPYRERRFLEKLAGDRDRLNKVLATVALHVGTPFGKLRDALYGQTKGA